MLTIYIHLRHINYRTHASYSEELDVAVNILFTQQHIPNQCRMKIQITSNMYDRDYINGFCKSKQIPKIQNKFGSAWVGLVGGSDTKPGKSSYNIMLICWANLP